MCSKHLVLLGPAARITDQSLQGKQEVALQLPAPATLRSLWAPVCGSGVCASGWRLGGQEEGLPPARVVVLWLALPCTLPLFLSLN